MKKQKPEDYCMCVWFFFVFVCLLSCLFAYSQWDWIKAFCRRRLLPSSSQHYRAWKTCLRCNCHLMCQCWRFLTGVNPLFMNISHYFWWKIKWLVAAVVTTVNTQKGMPWSARHEDLEDFQESSIQPSHPLTIKNSKVFSALNGGILNTALCTL